MAIIHRYPIVVWQDVAGQFTATVAYGADGTAVGRTFAEARDKLAEYLDWMLRRQPWLPDPDCRDSELQTVKVGVRGEYAQDDRRYPCREVIVLRVPCVVARLGNGLFGCSAPTLDIQFFFHEEQGLSKLLPHYVQQQFEGRSPREITRFAEPPQIRLEEIAVRVSAGDTAGTQVIPLPNLEEVAEALSDRRLRKQFGPAWERDDEVARLATVLREDTASVLLVGAPGSGKTTVLAAAVRQNDRLAAASPPSSLDPVTDRPSAKHRYWLTSAPRLMAGMKYLGQWEERCEELIRELQQIDGVLCIEHLLDLVHSGGETPQSGAAAFLAAYLQRRELRIVAEATAEEVDACRRLLPGLLESLLVVKLPEFGRPQAIAVLDHLAAEHERIGKTAVAKGVTEYVVSAFQRFMPYYTFPGRAVAFLESLFDRARRKRQTMISLDDAQQFFSQRTGLPPVFLRDDIALLPTDVEAAFRRRVVGQVDPCQEVTQLVTRFKAGLTDPSRPIGVFLLCGPTGVGKTELAKALADYFFGHGDQPRRMLRLDMSEYAGPGSGARLITAANGAPSDLIQQFRQQPFQLLLLDEIEKASPEVFDVLMNVFDEGRLTDQLGRVTSFRSAVIVMTSNLGASTTGSLGFEPSRPVRYADEALNFFRPEFFNRIDAVLSFEPLSRETILAITQKELAEIRRCEGLQAAGLRLTWNDGVVEHLAAAGFDPRYGARPLQRVLEELVAAPLARLLLAKPGLRDCSIAASMQDGRLGFDIVAHSPNRIG